MSIKSKVPLMILNWILLLLVCVKSEEEKCTPCGYTPSPPPPLVYPSPPPPIVYLSPPPPSPKKPPSVYCPPPPSSPSYQYITGPPGNLYPVDENFSGATPTLPHSFFVFFPLLVGLLVFYR
ncbi:putative leucine-rich repeat extensin-like protein 6 [Sesbania bispinosa]|nr:putative leucine-rich repeat extensin-like protein 6 [Sesbania bispinosa]